MYFKEYFKDRKYKIFHGYGNREIVVCKIPMILLFKHFTNIGSSGIWFSMSFSNALVCVYGYLVYKKDGWKRRVISTANRI